MLSSGLYCLGIGSLMLTALAVRTRIYLIAEHNRDLFHPALPVRLLNHPPDLLEDFQRLASIMVSSRGIAGVHIPFASFRR